MKQDRNGKLSDGAAARARWINQYRASGLGLKQFAEQHGLRPGQLRYWVYQPPKPSVTLASLPAFREVRLPAPAWAVGCWSTEIGLPNGTTVRLAREVDVARTIALLDSLRQPCSSR